MNESERRKEASLNALRKAAAEAVRKYGRDPRPGLEVDHDLAPKEELHPNEELDSPGPRSG